MDGINAKYSLGGTDFYRYHDLPMVLARTKRHNQLNAKAASKKSQEAAAKETATGISRTMRVMDILSLSPDALDLLQNYGINCAGCSVGGIETLEDGCRSHGFDEDDIDELVTELNTLVKEMPNRPQTLIITANAARALLGIALQEKRPGEGLRVTADGTGGFCMEFSKNPEGDERIFVNEEEPTMRIFASLLTLQRIGGATIDFREKRFKLDLPEDTKCCGGKDDSCACDHDEDTK